MRTPALLVPNNEVGRFYNALPDLISRMAQAVDDALRQAVTDQTTFESTNDCFLDSKQHLESILWATISDLDFAAIQAIGPVQAIDILKRAPIFTWDDRFPLEKTYLWAFGKEHLLEMPVQKLDNGLYRFPPAIAYALLSRQPNKLGELTFISDNNAPTRAVYDPVYGVCFTPEVAYCLIGDPGYTIENLGLAPRGVPNLIKTPVYAFVDGIAFGYDRYNCWYPLLFSHYVDVNFLFPSRSTYQFKNGQGLFAKDMPESTAFPWCSCLPNWPNFLVNRFADIGRDYQAFESKVQRGQWLQFGFTLLAIAGIGSAVNAIGSVGSSVQNVAKLVGSIDNLPGVDLGVAGDIAKGLSQGINLANKIPGGVQMFEFDDDVAELVDVSLDDIGAALDPDFDFSVFEAFGLDGTELLTDDIGNVYTVAGDAVTLDPETYVKSIYVDEAGNYRDFSNNVILSQADAEQVFNESGFDDAAVQQELFGRVQGIGGQYFDTIEGAAARPAGIPNPASQVQVPFFQSLSQEVLSWFKTITSYSLAKEQLEKTGRYTPPYQTSAVGTPYSQIPGVPVRRADGAIVTNNGNGTQTVQLPNGIVQTMPSNFSPGMTGGGQLIAGISNQTLLLAGAGLLAVLLIARR